MVTAKIKPEDASLYAEITKKEQELLSIKDKFGLQVTTPLMLFSERLKTFENNWLYKSGPCTAEAMAFAGWYALSDNCAKCTFCTKEMDGWEETDDPWEEHKSHKPDCPFVRLNQRDFRKWYSNEFVELHNEIIYNKVKDALEKKREEIVKQREELKASLLSSMKSVKKSKKK